MRLLIFVIIVLCFINVKAQSSYSKVILSTNLNEDFLAMDTIDNKLFVITRIEKYPNSALWNYHHLKFRLIDENLNETKTVTVDIDTLNVFSYLNSIEYYRDGDNIVIYGLCFRNSNEEFTFVVVLDKNLNVIFNRVLEYSLNLRYNKFIVKNNKLYVYKIFYSALSNLYKLLCIENNMVNGSFLVLDSTSNFVFPAIYTKGTSIYGVNFYRDSESKIICTVSKYNFNLQSKLDFEYHTKIITNSNVPLNVLNVLPLNNKQTIIRVQYSSIFDNSNIPDLEKDNALFKIDTNGMLNSVVNSNYSSDSSFSIASSVFKYSTDGFNDYCINYLKYNSNSFNLYRIQKFKDSSLVGHQYFSSNSISNFMSNRIQGVFSFMNELLVSNMLIDLSSSFRLYDKDLNLLWIYNDSNEIAFNNGKYLDINIIGSNVYLIADFLNSNNDKDIYLKKISGLFSSVQSIKQYTLKLYPNPSSDRVYLDLPVDNHQHRFEFYNTNGQLIKTGELENSIDVSDLDNGVYVLKVGYLVGRVIVSR